MKPEPTHTKRRIYCAKCKAIKPRTSPPKTEIPNHNDMLLKDPFCSRKCAEDYHESQLLLAWSAALQTRKITLDEFRETWTQTISCDDQRHGSRGRLAA